MKRSKPRRAELSGSRGEVQVLRPRGAVCVPLTLTKEPLEFLNRGRLEGRRAFIPDGIPVERCRLPKPPRDEQANRPLREGSEQLGMPIQEHSKIGRHVAGD